MDFWDLAPHHHPGIGEATPQAALTDCSSGSRGDSTKAFWNPGACLLWEGTLGLQIAFYN